MPSGSSSQRVTNEGGPEDLYVSISGLSFDEPPVQELEPAQRSRRKTVVPSRSHTPISQSSSFSGNQNYIELLGRLKRQQDIMSDLRSRNEEHSRSGERLGADLLAMTHRYLQAQTTIEALEKKCSESDAHISRLLAELEEAKSNNESLTRKFGQAIEDNERLRLRCEARDEPADWRSVVGRDSDRAETTTLFSTSDSLDFASRDKSIALDIQPEMLPDDVNKLVKTINVHISEIARACIASTTFRAGIRVTQVENKKLAQVAEGIGFILTQMLRTRDHSKSKFLVELGIQADLANRVSRIIDVWSFQTRGVWDIRSNGERMFINSSNF